MDMQILNLLIQPILGGFAGYITNEYALNMLFKSYTPLKIGGVIPKTRKQFIENISRLVEEDLITKDKIKEIIYQDKFVSNFDLLIEDFFNRSVYSAVENKPLKDIQPINEALENIKNFLSQQIRDNIITSSDALFTEIQCTKVISGEQSKAIGKNVLSIGKDAVGKTDLINSVIGSISAKKPITGAEILGDEFSHALAKNIATAAFNTDYIKEHYDQRLTSMLNSFFDRSNVYSTFIIFIEKVLLENKEAFMSYAHESIENYCQSEAFKASIKEIVALLIEYGKTIDEPVSSIFKEDYLSQVDEALDECMPDIRQYLENFLTHNEDKLNDILEESIEETIQEENMAKQAMLNLGKGKLQELARVSTIREVVANSFNEDSSKKLFHDKMLELVKNKADSTTIQELLAYLENNVEDKLDLLISYLPALISKNLDYYLDKFYYSLPTLLNNGISSNLIINNLIRLIKTNLLYSKDFEKAVQNKISTAVIDLLEQNQQYFLNNKTEGEIKALLLKLITDNEASLENFIVKSINEYLGVKSLKDLLNNFNTTEIYGKIQEYAVGKLATTKEKVENTMSHKDLKEIGQIKNIQEYTSQRVRSVFTDNLDLVLQGFIKSVVASNLNKLSDDELCDMAQNFMGKNMKPIMVFGGILGVLAGVILALLFPNTNVFAWLSISSIITFGLVGFLTNAIAINMLFRPYNRIKILSKIPLLRLFSIGYIPKNKEALADGISSEIKNRLLAKESLKDLLSENSEKISKAVLDYLSKNDYGQIKTLLDTNKENIVEFSTHKLMAEISNNLTFLSQAITVELCNIKFDREALKATSLYFINEYPKMLSDKIFEKLVDFKNSDKTLEEMLPKFLTEKISAEIEKNMQNVVQAYIRGITFDGFKGKLSSFNNGYTSFVNLTIAEIFSSFDTSSIKLNEDQLDALGVFSAVDNIVVTALKKLVDQAINTFFANPCSNSKKLLGFIEKPLAHKVKEKVNSSLGITLLGVYKIMGGDKLVESILQKALLNKLPRLIEANQEQIHQSVDEFLFASIYPRLVNPVSTHISANAINTVLKVPVREISKLKLKNIFATLKIDSLDNIFMHYEEDVRACFNKTLVLLKLHSPYIGKDLSQLAQVYLETLLKNKFGKDLFKDFDSKEFYDITTNLTDMLFDEENLSGAFDLVLNSIEELGLDFSLASIANKEILQASVEATINDLLNNKFILREVYNLISKGFSSIQANNYSVIAINTREYLITAITAAGISSLENNLSDLLSHIEFDTMAKEQVNKMSSKKIHTMFDSFASKYFRRLMIYGFGGVVFGINIYLGFLLAVVYVATKIIFYEKE